MSRVVPILQVDAFTARPFVGNPAGVVLEASGRLAVELYIADGRPTRVRVGGQAVTILSGTIRLE